MTVDQANMFQEIRYPWIHDAIRGWRI
jgi:hypothetical protein